MTTVKFINPYRDLSREDKIRTTIDIARSDQAALQTIRPGTVMQTTLSILLRKLVDALKDNGYDQFNPDGYEAAICDARIVIPSNVQRSPTPELSGGSRRKVRSTKAVG